MRGAIVGFGTIAAGHAVGYTQVPEMSIVAVVDPSPPRRAVAEAYGYRAYPTFDEMLDAEKPDFIDICAPPDTHVDYILLGLKHDLHVLCEKPVFLPSDNGGYDHLLDEISAARRVMYPCHNYKFAPILSAMYDVVSRPAFGAVLHAQFRTLRSGHAVGVADYNPHWRRDPRISHGGILRDHGPHSIYLAMHLTGGQPEAVSCLTGNLRRDEYGSTEDTAMLMIRCDNGAQISLDLSWSADYRNSYYSVAGTGGLMVVENDDMYHTLDGVLVRDVLRSDFDDPSHKHWFSRMFHDFLDVVAQPARQANLVREALMTSMVIDAGYASAAANGAWLPVSVPDLACD